MYVRKLMKYEVESFLKPEHAPHNVVSWMKGVETKQEAENLFIKESELDCISSVEITKIINPYPIWFWSAKS